MSIMDNEEAGAAFLLDLNQRIDVLSSMPPQDDEDDPWERVYKDIAKTIVDLTDVYIGLKFAEEHIREQKEELNDTE